MPEGDVRNNILNNESNTLDTQLKNVNATITSQRRVMALNDSYSKKMAMYTRLILAIIFALAIAILLKILKDKFMIIPDAVITIVYIILFSSCGIYGMFVISDINSRETTDFDKLELSPPAAVSKKMYSNTQHGFDLGNLDLLPGYCIGASCCSTDTATIWDDEKQNCKIGCAVGSTYNSDAKTCTACAAGKTSTGNTATACTDCAAGTYSAAGKGCTTCAAGTYSAAAGSASCTSCGTGKTSPAGSINASACVAVPQ